MKFKKELVEELRSGEIGLQLRRNDCVEDVLRLLSEVFPCDKYPVEVKYLKKRIYKEGMIKRSVFDLGTWVYSNKHIKRIELIGFIEEQPPTINAISHAMEEFAKTSVKDEYYKEKKEKVELLLKLYEIAL